MYTLGAGKADELDCLLVTSLRGGFFAELITLSLPVKVGYIVETLIESPPPMVKAGYCEGMSLMVSSLDRSLEPDVNMCGLSCLSVRFLGYSSYGWMVSSSKRRCSKSFIWRCMFLSEIGELLSESIIK